MGRLAEVKGRRRAAHAYTALGRFGRLMILAAGIAACSSDSGLRPFTSDGCSLFPDSSLINRDDWCTCCFEHDLVYWRGGSFEEREAAEAGTRRCADRRVSLGGKAASMCHLDGCKRPLCRPPAQYHMVRFRRV